MELLQRRIKGDWFELRELPVQYFAVRDHMQLPDEEVAALATELRDGTHEHLPSLKRERLLPVFFAVEEGKYQTLATEQIAALAAVTRQVLSVVMLQRVAVRAAKGGAGDGGDDDPPDVSAAVGDLQIGDIVRDVSERVAADAELQHDSAVKAILLKAKEYRRERDKLEELAAAARPDQRQRLQASFAQTFDGIFAAIRKHYGLLVGEAVRATQAADGVPILQRADVSLLEPVLTRQAESISGIHSTVAFAAAERYKTRELLSGLEAEKLRVDELLDEELVTAERAAQSKQGATDLLRAIEGELVAGIEKHLARPPAEPEVMV